MSIASENAGAAPALPLCVDLDGTLVRTDTLQEGAVALLRRQPWALALMPLWLLRGRAHLKAQVAARTALDPRALPYDEELIAFLRRERGRGRAVWLVTGAAAPVARAVAAHVGCFDGLVATDGDVNLTGTAKARALQDRFPGGFEYAGNSTADLPVWRAARAGIVVNASPRLRRRAEACTDVAHAFSPRAPLERLRTVLRAVRVRQWAKNLLVFVPPLASHHLDRAALGSCLLAFLALSMLASAVYVTNDLLDLAADRKHATKRRRPLASGALPLAAAPAIVVAFLAAGAALASRLPAGARALLCLYVVLTTAYSAVLKNRALVDVLALAMLYTVRLFVGGAATSTRISEWLAALSMFLFLSLALAKRGAELCKATANERLPGRGYRRVDVDTVLGMGLGSGYLSVLVLALYINGGQVRSLYAHPDLLWGVAVALLYWISRIWLLVRRGELDEDPVAFATTDRHTYVLVTLSVGLLALAAQR